MARVWALPFALLLVSAGWALARVDSAAARQALLDADKAFARETGENGLEGFLSFFAEDATIFPPNSPILRGKARIREHYAKAFGTPGFRLTWTPIDADVAENGDLGYTYGTFEMSKQDASGRLLSRSGKYCTIWKKQSDGRWKVVADIGNTGDVPAPGRERPVEII